MDRARRAAAQPGAHRRAWQAGQPPGQGLGGGHRAGDPRPRRARTRRSSPSCGAATPANLGPAARRACRASSRRTRAPCPRTTDSSAPARSAAPTSSCERQGAEPSRLEAAPSRPRNYPRGRRARPQRGDGGHSVTGPWRRRVSRGQVLPADGPGAHAALPSRRVLAAWFARLHRLRGRDDLHQARRRHLGAPGPAAATRWRPCCCWLTRSWLLPLAAAIVGALLAPLVWLITQGADTSTAEVVVIDRSAGLPGSSTARRTCRPACITGWQRYNPYLPLMERVRAAARGGPARACSATRESGPTLITVVAARRGLRRRLAAPVA